MHSKHTRSIYLQCRRFSQNPPTPNHLATHPLSHTVMDPKGTIVFTTVGRPHYGFDIFSLKLPSNLDISLTKWTPEHLLTDGISINFNGQFVDEDETLVYISERTGSSRIYLNRTGIPKPEQLASIPGSHFHDRPIIKNGRLYFVSAYEQPDEPFKSWSALYSTGLDENKIVRLTPYGTVDYSPAISRTGKFIAVASNGSRPWSGEFHELQTDIVVFRGSDPDKRTVVCERGGWPTWSGDSTIYFHRQADDGWWSIFRVDFSESFELSGDTNAPLRITPPGVHTFTPAAMHDGKRIVVATRRRDKNFRHIEIYDLESQKFYSVTESLNPNFHHYNPFLSTECGFLGYHRFRGESAPGESTIPHLEPVMSPIKELRMLRLNGSFPSLSPNSDLIALNHDFDKNSGVKIVKSDGSKRWSLLKGRTAFYNSWSPTENDVIYTSIGPIFQSPKSTVQIARITFDLSKLDDREDITANVKILTGEDTGNNAFPACSPDGKFVVFRSGRSGHKNLYIIDAVNGEFNGGTRQLTKGPWIDTMPSWSPDGRLIAFSSNRHNPDNVDAFSIYVIRPDGSDLRRIHVAGPEGSGDVDRERINHVCFSRDSEWLLFAANLGGVTAEPVSWPNQFQPYGDLYVVRLDGSGLRRLTWNGYENGTPAWISGGELDVGRLCLGGEVGDKLRGQFEATPSQLCSSKSGMFSTSQAQMLKPTRTHLVGKEKGMKITCQATSISADRVPDMGKRELMNLLLLGALSLPTAGMLVPYATFFAPPGSGGAGGGTIAKDALGNDVVASEWLKTHGPGDRTLTQGLKGDPTYLVVEKDKTLATYGINAVCTHLGCVVPWNTAENKFICPCHGSQYNNQGKVVRGPAPLSLALAHADIDDGKVVFVPWVETDFRTGEAPWWA